MSREAITRPDDGVWVSYYGDRSGFYVHSTELDALRDAVGSSRQIVFVKWGEELTEAIRRATAEVPF